MYDTIYHLSDIHIRLNSRQKEYEYVFHKVYDYLRRESKPGHSIAVITGDILHSKVDLQPECTMMTYEFLKEMGSILPTIVIAGNHDALLNNPDRIDSITSILHNRHPPNVFYYKKSGIYRHDNLIFVVNSVLDNQTEWVMAPLDKEKNSVTVGLYHGQLYGWKNNHGYVSEIGEKNLSDFAGCQLVLLGDIHKYQYMNAEKTVGYAGSLISQNFGETDNDHGILVWDVKTRSSFLQRIENPFAYKEFRIVNDNETSFLDIEGNTYTIQNVPIPLYGNVKFRLPVDYDMHLPSTLRRKYSTARLQFHIQSTTTSVITPQDEDVSLQDEELICEYLRKRWSKLNTEQVQKVRDDLLRDFHESRYVHTYSRMSWELEYLRFENLFGYGKNNEVDFRGLSKHTVTGIFGKNSVGKSTLIDILSFMFYGRITRSSHGNSIPKEVIHFDEKTGWGEVGIKFGSSRYILKKMCQRVNNDKIKIVETLYEVDEKGTMIQLTEEQRRKTDKLVHNIIGGYKTFLYTNMFLQQREESFRDMKQALRKDFLYELFGLDWFDTYRKKKEDEWKSAKNEEKMYHKRTEDTSLEQWETKLQCFERELTEKKTCIQLNLERQYELENKRETCLKNLKPCLIQGNVSDIDAEIMTAETRLDQLQQERHVYTNFLVENNRVALEERLKTLEKKNIMFIDHPLSKKYGPYESSFSFQEWNKYFKTINDLVENSSHLLSEWRTKEEDYTKEINRLLGLKPSFDETLLLPDDRDWNRWVEEFETMNQRWKKHEEEWENMTPVPDMDERIEEALCELENRLHKSELIRCQYEMMKQQLSTDKHVSYNKDCESCMTNPHYIHRKKALTECKKLRQQLSILSKESDVLWSTVADGFPEGKDDDDTSLQEIVKKARAFLHQQNKQRQIYMAKKQEIMEFREKMSIFEKRFKNTNNYRTAKKAETKIAKLEKQKNTDPLFEKYTTTLRVLDDLKIYRFIDEMWKEENEDSVRHLLQKYDTYQRQLQETDTEIKVLTELVLKKKLDIEKIRLQKGWMKENEKTQSDIEHYEKEIAKLKEDSKKLEASEREIEHHSLTTRAFFEEWKKDVEILKELQKKTKYLETIVLTTERDGLPLYLLKMKLPTIENDINHLISPFLTKKLVLTVDEKDVLVGIETSQKGGGVSNYLGGMESFIIDLALKLGFSKFANLSHSNFFIIDEGISVMDRERINNVSHLFDFLSHITDHVLLISHLPTIKDFVHQSIEVLKDESSQKSRLIIT